MTECTTTECNNPTDEYLCGQCVQDLQAWINQIPALLTELPATIAKTDVLRKGSNEGGNGTHKAGSKAPLNLDALYLKQNLEGIVNASAKNYSRTQPQAALIATQIANLVTDAEHAISGPEPEHINHHENRKRIETIAPPMPTRHLVPWLRKHAGVTLTTKDVRNWAARGHITPVTRFPTPTYRPHEVIAALHRKNQP